MTSVLTDEVRARIARMDREEVRRKVEAYLEVVFQAVPAEMYARAVGPHCTEGTEADARALLDFVDNARTHASAEMQELLAFWDEQTPEPLTATLHRHLSRRFPQRDISVVLKKFDETARVPRRRDDGD